MDKLKVGIVSLGCDKNRIDSEIALGEIGKKYEIISDAKKADIIIVNTCGFIETSKQESIDAIIEMAEFKNEYNCTVLVATGCLTQRYGQELLDLIPEIDILLGVNSYDKLLKSVDDFIISKKQIFDITFSDKEINSGNRIITTGKATAYIRISEGCDNLCTYCIIPKIRGKYRSRKIEDIVQEANQLASQGVKELILVAQDTTRYGEDLYGVKKLPELLKEISQIEKIQWIRVLYTYVEEITEELINEIAENQKICKYIDMPIQHISNDILKRMSRRGRKEDIIATIYKMREKIPGIALRTSLIVGFPGETEEDFQELKDFVKEIRFDKLGVFKYSQEENTPAAQMENQIDESVKIKREEEIMLLQQGISKSINEKKKGTTFFVIVEGMKNDSYFGRNFEMSPEIDGAIYFKCDKLIKAGEIVEVKITNTLEYDLLGVVEDEPRQ
ncbi:MAG: 30S ribosomal protein S12 methylthiotransferase RimO [Clostridiaceae bacterium]|nr:30S ribosomal protein S12 methylthiotransferase RimO [Clostridiaceae bacterium]